MGGNSSATALWTIGHGTTDIKTFLEQLASNGIETLVDIRSYPGSRHSPQFGRLELADSLSAVGLAYVHVGDLGGRRSKQDIDPTLNAAWRNRSFRNYADYTLTAGFETGLEVLLELADRSPIAYMCSETVPWRCHRLLVSNVLVARGHVVTHIVGDSLLPHVLGAWGAEPSCVDGRVTYPADAGQISLPFSVSDPLSD